MPIGVAVVLERHPGLDRAVEVEVLLAVEDRAEQLAGDHAACSPSPAAWKAGTIANTGGARSPAAWAGDRVVGGGGVGGDPLAVDLELDRLAGGADRVGLELGARCR